MGGSRRTTLRGQRPSRESTTGTPNQEFFSSIRAKTSTQIDSSSPLEVAFARFAKSGVVSWAKTRSPNKAPAPMGNKRGDNSRAMTMQRASGKTVATRIRRQLDQTGIQPSKKEGGAHTDAVPAKKPLRGGLSAGVGPRLKPARMFGTRPPRTARGGGFLREPHRRDQRYIGS